MRRKIRAARAADILGEWGDKALRPLCSPSSEELDFSLEPACDAFLKTIADAPDQNLSTFAPAVLRLAWARILYVVGTAMVTPEVVMTEVPSHWRKERILRALLAGELARLRLPREWHPERPFGSPPPPAPGSPRLN